MGTPKTEFLNSRPYVAIRIKVNLKNWGKANALFPELLNWLRSKGHESGGPPFYQYFVMGDMAQEFDLRAGLLTRKLIEGNNRIERGFIPEGKYATLIHEGHPDKLKQSHRVLQNWLRERNIQVGMGEQDNHETCKGCYEFYLTNPEDEPDPNNWKTEIAYLIR